MSPFIDPKDAVLLMIDHQSGLFQTVKDIAVQDLRRNATQLVKLAKLSGVPVITTASAPNGPNGPLMPELHQADPDAIFVPRNGEINSWDSQAFVDAVKATGRRTLVIAGVWTSVCVAFPALSAKKDGYDVYAVFDASGDISAAAAQVTMARLVQAGVVPTTTNAVGGELQKTWNRNDAAEYAAIYGELAPNYASAIESYYAPKQAA